MRETVKLALENKVEIGAHPSYPDKANFGRKTVTMEPADLKQTLLAQMMALKQIAEAEGGKLDHVKPHGALYNDAAKDESIAKIILEAILEFDQKLPVYVPQNSVISDLAKGKVEVIFEAFADRNYEENYQLVSRHKTDALITEKEAVFEHLFSMFRHKKISCHNSAKLDCIATTFCIHSDTHQAVEILKYFHKKFREHNVQILHT
jgi:UPF0271 protein